jgi:transcriptional regulator with AAA-type ATPase domain
LSAEERQRLTVVRAAAFANPFSQERDELDYKIAGLGRKVPNAQLMEAVKEAVGRLLRGKRLPAYGGEERALVKAAAMFHWFHRHEATFDRFIAEQVAAGDDSVRCEFGDEVLAELEAFGFSAAEADRVFAIFFQLRRAYYFLARTLAGAGPAMNALRRQLWNNVFTFHAPWYESLLYRRMEDFSTLLLGETGTGKGTVAAAIGRSNFIPYDRGKKKFRESFMQAFVAINLSQFPASLIESELFGHKKGAFTGAVEAHLGVFARGSPHGAIFIDEVGDVEPWVQVKLLKVLQERVFTPVGSREKIRFGGRVIAATNKDVDELRARGEMRHDFYYRLCSDVITVPPLRQRLAEDAGELDLLLAHVVAGLLGDEAAPLLPTIRAHLDRALPRGYGWPGNVRELEQAVRRILHTGTYAGDRARTGAPADGAAPATAHEVLAAHCRKVYAALGTYEETARAVGLDRRTVKKYVDS